ncbi:hypothetical protein LTR10_017433 [Elasticomyces elasticus]|uniref:Zn(2)-C6 fungal-type domain-containing protein n=1 Tax=Exophiala sideris TaxID=1016849 RepID=A0ABR0JAI7_9EURO|nr:hypothetical protein LTR10_017433 [Elasticomyces elasticus]KAK5030385.1 hypothetical protein LTS07_005169 [Exophiala sideris]KAK5038438.1 hypothetical protein LTR13_004185 [Exophiala sideris]KAK5060321.1 hypothetical protein LTR69_005638 [Exophiala sideris]KAK5183231.1 hypothetical protein LTR44_004232 [Eurotiomycetes sp. CCFEE 6388]
MVPSSGRRQNASCDPCRHSKKRCAFDPGSQPGSGAPCQNCAHLGHLCTFNFVAARRAQKGAKILASPKSGPFSGQASPPAASPAAASVNALNPGVAWTTIQPPTEREMHLDNMIWAGLGPQTFLDFDTFFATEPQGWMDLSEGVLNNDILGTGYEVNNDAITPLVSPTGFSSQSQEKLRHFEDAPAGDFWHGSSIQLLNSTALTEGVTKNFSRIYDTMMVGLASRYLSYVCNQFAGAHGYIIEPENAASQLTSSDPEDRQRLPDEMLSLTGQCCQSGWGQTVRQSTQKPIESFRRITLIGVARFLDNFSTLYGNKLDPKKRKLDEDTFTSVLQAFASQFASPDDLDPGRQDILSDNIVESAEDPASSITMNQVFTAAWFNAHSHLTQSINNRSFVHLYSVFLFHMTAVPSEASSKIECSGSPLRFLDRALHQLKSLTALLSFLILFWNLGVLRVVEAITMASKVLETPSDAQTAKLTINYEAAALRRIVAISERISEASAHGDVRLSDASEDKLPLISHHANTGLTALGLSTAIEHAISGAWLAELPSYLEPTTPPILTSNVMASIKTLLAGLSTLHRTISGECAARPALRNLLRRYGDIIMDCWDENSTET